MMFKDQPLILASKSPRRRELLTLWGVPFDCHWSDAEEPELEYGEQLGDYVNRVAQVKAEAVARQFPERLVLGSDTIVAVHGEILGKPTDDAQAREFLRKLSGTRHEVWTGTALVQLQPEWSYAQSDVTKVLFRQLTDEEIDWYISTGEPMDKAGAYAIQGEASKFVQKIDGDMDTVIGLPKKVVLSGLEKWLFWCRNGAETVQ